MQLSAQLTSESAADAIRHEATRAYEASAALAEARGHAAAASRVRELAAADQSLDRSLGRRKAADCSAAVDRSARAPAHGTHADRSTAVDRNARAATHGHGAHGTHGTHGALAQARKAAEMMYERAVR
jgi:hypothetical protein